MNPLLKERLVKTKDLIPEPLHESFTKFYNFFTNSTLTKKQALNLSEPILEYFFSSSKVFEKELGSLEIRERLKSLNKNMSVIKIFLSLQLEKKPYLPQSVHYSDFIHALSSKNFPKRMIYLFLLANTKTKLDIKEKITKEEREILSLLPSLTKMSYPDRIEFFDAGLTNLSYSQFRVFLKLPYNYLINQIDRCESYEDFCQIRKKTNHFNQKSNYEDLFQQELSANLWKYDYKTDQYKRTTIELNIGSKVVSI